MCEIPLQRIVPGNNPCLLLHSDVERIKAAIQNSGWDTSSIFIVQLVSEDPRFANAEEVRKDEQLLKFVVEEGNIGLEGSALFVVYTCHLSCVKF